MYKCLAVSYIFLFASETDLNHLLTFCHIFLAYMLLTTCDKSYCVLDQVTRDFSHVLQCDEKFFDFIFSYFERFLCLRESNYGSVNLQVYIR